MLAHEKRKAKSTPINTITFPDDLPVETQIIDLPENQKVDPVTGLALVCIGEESSFEQFEWVLHECFD
ncbi:MAG: hypothetical protein NTZ52_01910 [Chlamydiae bacterium]|nr:hypothetical protein [Chlamydiota bacterium]